MAIADIRREYALGSLRRADLDANPLAQFNEWFAQAASQAVAKDPGKGWVNYLYINPAQGDELQRKTSYVRRVDDTWFIGAGTYAPEE